MSNNQLARDISRHFSYIKNPLQQREQAIIGRSMLGTKRRRQSIGGGGKRIKVSGDALINTAGAIAPYFGPYGKAAAAAIGAYQIARGFFKGSKKKGPYGGVSTARYHGKFERTKTGISSSLKHEVVTQSKGVIINKEVYGKVADPDCIYVGHSTYDPDTIAITVACAAIRKLFKKAGYNATSIDEVIPFRTDTTANSIIFEYSKVNIDASRTVVTYIVNPNDSVAIIANSSGFLGDIKALYNYQAGATVPVYAEFEYMYLRSSTSVLLSSLQLKNEVLELWVNSNIAVQNRTKSDSGSSTTDVVDNQPLKGFRYQFAGGVPKSKQNDNEFASLVDKTGLILLRAAQLAPADCWKEPPLPKQWNNCVSSSYVRLEPGSLKTGSIHSQWRGYFNNILQRLFNRNNAGGIVKFAPGKVELYALEETLNSGSANLITASYEKELRCGAFLITGKAPVCLIKQYDAEASNLPA